MEGQKLMSKEHWEKKYSTCPPESKSPADAFNPRKSKDRPKTYVKVNETDH